jgi:hypothetical protein
VPSRPRTLVLNAYHLLQGPQAPIHASGSSKMSLQSPNDQIPLLALWLDEQGYFSYPQTSPTSSPASTAGAAVEYQHGWLTSSDRGDEASQFLDFDYAPPVTTVAALPIFRVVSLEPYDFLPHQASLVGLSVIRVYINVS